MSRVTPRHWLFGIVLTASVMGCAPRKAIDGPVAARSAEEFAAFRDALNGAVPLPTLEAFDTAVQELKLEAMSNGVSGVGAREERVRQTVNGKSLQVVLTLGWKARAARLQRELKDMTDRYEHDRELLNRAGGSASSQHLANLTANEQDIIAQLKHQLADTEQKLSAWQKAEKK